MTFPFTARLVFVILIVFTALFQTLFVGQILFTPAQMLTMFQVPFTEVSDLAGLLLMIAAGQVFLVAVCAASIYWTFTAPPFGYATGILVGLLFLGIGIAIWVLRGGPTAFAVIDIARGGLTVLSGLLATRHQPNNA